MPVESGLYYLPNRYYNPLVSAFMSRDSVDYSDPTTISGLNLYGYCGYDPVNRVDPWGNLSCTTLLIVLIATAIISTVEVITYGLVTDSEVVLDLSVSFNTGGGVGFKLGISVVLDFKNDNIEFYGHYGIEYCVKPNTFGISYSPGLILNYENPGDYAGPFNNFGGGWYWGGDHCYDPRISHSDAVQAYSISFGNNKGIYFGKDEYDYFGNTKMAKIVN